MADETEKPAAPPPAAPKPAAPAKPAAAPAAKPAAGAHAAGGADHVPKAAPATGPSDPPPPADKTQPACITTLQAAIPGAVTLVSYFVGDWTVIVKPETILEVAQHLRYAPDAAFDLCTDLTASDWPPRTAARF